MNKNIHKILTNRAELITDPQLDRVREYINLLERENRTLRAKRRQQSPTIPPTAA